MLFPALLSLTTGALKPSASVTVVLPIVVLPSFAVRVTPSILVVGVMTSLRPFLIVWLTLRRVSLMDEEGRACGVPLEVTWSVACIVVGWIVQ